MCLSKMIFDRRNWDTTEVLEKEQEAELDFGDFFLEEFLEISLNAIIGNPTSITMRLVV